MSIWGRNKREKPEERTWIGRGPDEYITKGGKVFRLEGWWALVDNRVRGPMSCLDAAMTAASEMIAESARGGSITPGGSSHEPQASGGEP